VERSRDLSFVPLLLFLPFDGTTPLGVTAADAGVLAGADF